MQNIKIKGSHDAYYVPTVDFNAQTGVCSISGESYLEDTLEFYTPLLDWLKEYFENGNNTLTFNINLSYYNTSSSKCLVDILVLLKKYKEQGKDITVNWYYDDKSEDADEEIEEVEDFMLETKIDINLLPKSNL